MAFIIADRVMEICTTTGTGSFNLAERKAVLGFRSVLDVCGNEDFFHYAIVAVDASGTPTGQWEVGLGAISGDGYELSRQTVYSNDEGSTSRIAFAAGDKQVFITTPAYRLKQPTWMMSAAFYVSTTGSDNNPGTSAAPYRTIQYALETIMRKVDMEPLGSVTLYLADGTYTDECILPSCCSSNNISIVGNEENPAAVILTNAGTNTLALYGEGQYSLSGMKIGNTSEAGSGIYTVGGHIRIGKVQFAACSYAHIYLENARAFLQENYTIAGAAKNHIYANSSSRVAATGIAVTLTGTPDFSTSFIGASGLSIIDLSGMTYSGAATGKKYDVTQNSVVIGSATIPGSVAGTSASGGQAD